MPPRAKRRNTKKPSDSSHKEKRDGDEKENICSDILRKVKKSNGRSIKFQSEPTKKEELEKSPQKQNLKLKTVGFWSKKLQDLELLEGVASAGICSLYEFNGTDESNSCQKTRKSKRKAGVSKKRKPKVPGCNKPAPMCQNPVKKTNKITESEKKIKQIHGQTLFREQIMLRKERGKLADRSKKFTFSTGMPSLGITSTPTLNKDNLIGASNFLFLSPIIKEESEDCGATDGYTPLKSRVAECPDIGCKNRKTPKAESELKRMSCRRVLRSGRMLNT